MKAPLPYPVAVERVLKHAPRLSRISSTLVKSDGLVCAKSLRAREDSPPFHASAMDGYAVRSKETKAASSDHPVSLPVRWTIAAGEWIPREPGRMETARIMTGAPVPPWSDGVIELERVGLENGAIYLSHPVERGRNLRPRGSDVKKGSTLIEAGNLITPGAVTILASQGIRTVSVVRKPAIGLLVSGDELVHPDQNPRPGQIRDSNSLMVERVLHSAGFELIETVRVGDSPAKTRQALRRLLAKCDVVLTTGGVSAGVFDHVRAAFSDVRAEILFWKVAQKPGKPLVFAQKGRKLLFGLPGNPVSVLVCLLEYALPACRRMAGFDLESCRPKRTSARLARVVSKREGRTDFIRVELRTRKNRIEAVPCAGQESYQIRSLTDADGFAVLPADRSELRAGENVTVHLLPWSRR